MKEANTVLGANGKWDEFRPIVMEEFRAFTGLLYVLGVTKGANESLDQLWSMEWGRPFVRATMSLERFKAIIRFIRFDDKETRQKRRENDKLALLYCIQAKIYVFQVYMPPSWIFHFRFLPVWSYNIATTSIG